MAGWFSSSREVLVFSHLYSHFFFLPPQQPSDGVQSSLPVPIIITISTVIPSALVILTIACAILVILIARWRIASKQADVANILAYCNIQENVVMHMYLAQWVTLQNI